MFKWCQREGKGIGGFGIDSKSKLKFGKSNYRLKRDQTGR